MSSYLSDNDDDLFEYDPTLESSTASEEPGSSHEDLPLTGSGKEFIDTVKSSLSHNQDIDLEEDLSKLNLNISYIYSSFEEAIHSFVYSFKNDHYLKSVHVTLDSLTDGRFSLLNMFHFYEMRIARKIALIGLFSNIFSQDDESVSPFLHEISRVLNSNFTTLYYRSTFKTTLSILNHSLTVDRIVYTYLSQKLDIPVKDILLGDIEQYTSAEIDEQITRIELRGFNDALYEQMFSAFFAKEPTEDSLAAMLTATFSSPVSYLNSYQKMQGG